MLHWNLEYESCFNLDGGLALLSSLLIPNHSSHYDTVPVILIIMPVTFESMDQKQNPLVRVLRRKPTCSVPAVRRSS